MLAVEFRGTTDVVAIVSAIMPTWSFASVGARSIIDLLSILLFVGHIRGPVASLPWQNKTADAKDYHKDNLYHAIIFL